MNSESNSLKRTLNWTAGLSIALGVPLLILPSIIYFTKYVWAFSICIWGISVAQGFIQNLAYGEMAIDFPTASGIPGYCTAILGETNRKPLHFLGGFSAWSYWFAWAPIPAIFILSIVEFLTGLFPDLLNIPQKWLALAVGTPILWILFLNARKGFGESKFIGYLMNVISLVPIIVIAVVPMCNGSADIHRITQQFIPPDICFGSTGILLLLGILGMAQWSACAWETAAVYGPEYQNPNKDVPKALIGCGMICFVVFILVQASCIACLGRENLVSGGLHPVLALANLAFGEIGTKIMAFVFVIGILTIIKTGFLGASRAMYSMSIAGDLPVLFQKTNKHTVPQNAMLAIVILNYAFLLLRSPSSIVAASSIGYCFANGITLFCYVKHKRKKNRSKSGKSGFSMPKFWDKCIIVCAGINIPFYVAGLVYLNYLDSGWTSTVMGAVILAAYLPLYLVTQKHKQADPADVEKSF